MKQVLWTIQHEAAWEVFEKTGVLVANEDHLFCQDDLRFAYDWMSQQMMQRIGAPPEGVRYPVWATYQWEGKRKREDLRRAGYAERGTPMVQITFEAEENEFLLSDFDLWCQILASDYLATSEAEWDAYYADHPHTTQKDVEPSWQRVFDLTILNQIGGFLLWSAKLFRRHCGKSKWNKSKKWSILLQNNKEELILQLRENKFFLSCR